MKNYGCFDLEVTYEYKWIPIIFYFMFTVLLLVMINIALRINR